MSVGAVFKLVLRDERFDKYFTASDYLRQRFDKIRVRRATAGEQNVQPTFLDIERSHTLYIHAAYHPYVAIASEYARVKPSGDGTSAIGAAGGTCHFTFPTYGHFTSDMAVHVRIHAVGDKNATTATAETPYLRYCALPGVRMFKNVELRSDHVVIDNYVPDDVVAASKFFVHTDHRTGWERCNGQQEAREATYFANGYTANLTYLDGPQTPKLYQPELDMIVPLDFWFCKDAAHALLNDLIPNTQRTVTCALAPLRSILQALIPDPNNPGELIETPLPINSLKVSFELYVNGLYVNPEIHDIFASRIGFSLIRVHRRQVNQLQSATGAFLLDQLKFPAEFLLVGIRERNLVKSFDQWWLMGRRPVRDPSEKIVVPAMIWNSDLAVCQLVCRNAVDVSTLDSAVSTIGVTAHGIEIFPQLPSKFYNAYMPIRYAKNTMVVSPMDKSALLVNFCLYPGKFAPSGHYNLSAGREMYINYTLKSDVAANVKSGEYEMVISMSALNFLVRKGDNLSLRYSL